RRNPLNVRPYPAEASRDSDSAMAATRGATGQSSDGAWPGGPGRVEGMLSLDELRSEAEAGSIDTVVAAFTDMQGRLMGKRINASFFVEDVTEHGIEACDYLLALDMEMDPVPGY